MRSGCAARPELRSRSRTAGGSRTSARRRARRPSPVPGGESSRLPQDVAGAAYGVKHARLAAGLELPAQGRDEHVDGVGLGERVIAPDVVQQRLARDDDPLVPHEVLEQLELAGGQLERALAAEDLVGVGVEAQVADHHECAAPRRPAAQERPQPSQQLLALERLDEVVVGPRVEPLDPRVDRVARGEYEDRHVAVLPQPATYLHAVQPRQPQVEHHGVRLEDTGLLERDLAVVGHAHLVALLVERAPEDARDVDVVLDYEDPGTTAHLEPHGREGSALLRRNLPGWRAAAGRGAVPAGPGGRRSSSPSSSSASWT